MVQSGYTTTVSQLNISHNEIQQRINVLSTALQKYTENSDNNVIQLTNNDVNKLKHILSVHRQHDIFIDQLMNSLVNVKTDIDNCLQWFQNELQQIHGAVKFRTAVPTEKIFVC